MHVQFKLTFSRKIQQNKINYRNMPKGNENVPNLNMLFCGSVLKVQKNWWQKTKKKYFAECQVLALGKINSLPSAKRGALGKEDAAGCR